MSDGLNGATRLHLIVGDPIAQVKSPAGVTQAFVDAGHNAICVPAHVSPADLAPWFDGVKRAQNVDGLIVTVPHKFAAFHLCDNTSERAAFLHAVNVARRQPDGRWLGDMFDGLGYVTALKNAGAVLAGRRVLLVGAGGAGSAIAHALVLAGVSELAVADADEQRCTALLERLASMGKARVRPGGSDPTGFDIVLNATPMGMRDGDPLPVDVSRLTSAMFCGCVITAPAVSPFIAEARARGCATITGADMFAQVRDLMVDFLLGDARAGA